MQIQIAGMPRSGTAWLATVLNFASDVMVVHEGPDKNIPVPSMAFKHSGQAGSHLLIPSLRDLHADLRVYLDRDSEVCYDSTDVLFDDMVPIETWNEEIRDRAEKYKLGADFTIKFENLFTVRAVKFVWESVTEQRFEEDKVRAMLNMNVQRHCLEFDIDEKLINELKGEM